MVKQTEIIRQPTICMTVFDYFVGLALKVLLSKVFQMLKFSLAAKGCYFDYT